MQSTILPWRFELLPFSCTRVGNPADMDSGQRDFCQECKECDLTDYSSCNWLWSGLFGNRVATTRHALALESFLRPKRRLDSPRPFMLQLGDHP